MSGSLSVVSFEGELNAIVQEVLQLIIHQIKLLSDTENHKTQIILQFILYYLYVLLLRPKIFQILTGTWTLITSTYTCMLILIILF